jgi:thymidylate synthase (FAD)
MRSKVIALLRRDQGNAYADYTEMIQDGIARELARINLPLSLYTEWYWQMDLHNLFHFLRLRLDRHAQWEIREYGRVIADMVRAVAPLSYTAFERHWLNGKRFSAVEIEAIRDMLAGHPLKLEGRARADFEAKLNAEGLCDVS